MDIMDVLRAIARRYWVVLPILIVTFVGAALVVTNAIPTYEARATLQLVDPTELGRAEPQTASSQFADTRVIVEVVLSDTTRTSLGKDASADYTVSLSDNGKIISVQAFGDQDAVVPTASAVIGAISGIFADVEEDLGETTKASFEVLAQPTQARERIVTVGPDVTATEYYALGAVLVDFQETDPIAANPIGAGEGTLRALEIVAESASIKRSEFDIDPEEGTRDYSIDLIPRTSILTIDANGTSSEETIELLGDVSQFLEAKLDQRQAATGADESTWLEFETLAADPEGERVSGNLRRPLLTVLGLGVVAAVSLAVLADNLLNLRSERRRPRNSTDEVPDEAPTAENQTVRQAL